MASVSTGDRIMWKGDDLWSRAEIPLQGRIGLEDALAAAAAALSYGVEPSAVMRAMEGFTPLPHRLEVVTRAGGVTFIDDSKATNPHATLAAVMGMEDVVLIAGGRSKGVDLSSLAATVPPVRAVVALGESKDEVVEVFDPLVPVEAVTTMEDAVDAAFRLADGRGSVLLSPGCASLDMYASYSQRGEVFARAVSNLIAGGRIDGHS